MITSQKRGVFWYDDRDIFYRGVLRIVVARIKASLAGGGHCKLALSGGRTPKRLLELLSEEIGIGWQEVDIFWVDERCVSTDHPDSNFGMAQKALLSRIEIPEKNIHGIVTEGHSPPEAACAYEFHLKKHFEDALPEFDVTILGMGMDGHTASLFPGDMALYEKDRWAVAVDGEKGVPSVPRVTMTLPLINNSRCCIFLVSGAAKWGVVDEILYNRSAVEDKYPAAMIDPKGELIWNIS